MTTEPRDIHFRVKPFLYNSAGSTLVLYAPSLISDTQFSLRNRKKRVLIGTADVAAKSYFFVGNGIEWEIEKLTKTEFIIEKTYNNLRYRLEFKN